MMAETKKFLVKGNLKMGKESRPFSKEILGTSKKYVEDKAKSIFGSNYKLKRNRVIVSSVEEVQ